MKKSLSLILILTLLFSLMLCIVPTAEPTPASEIKGSLEGKYQISMANIVFDTNVHLLIAVDIQHVGSANWNNWAAAKDSIYVTVNGERLPDSTAADRLDKEDGTKSNQYVCFKYANIGAKSMGDELEIKVFHSADATTPDDTVTYSVLEYAVKAKELYPDDSALMNVIDKMLAYGAAAQSAFGHSGDYALGDADGNVYNYSIASLYGGATFANGKTKTLIKEGETLTASVAGSSANYYWLNSEFSSVSTGNTLAVSYSTSTQKYTPTQFYFNMDDYSGDKQTISAKNTAINVNDYNTLLTNDGSIEVTNGYIKATTPNTNNRTQIALGQDNDKLGLTNKIALALQEVASRPEGQRTFTLSFSVASSAVQPITDITFRNSTVGTTMYSDAAHTTAAASSVNAYSDYYYDANGSKLYASNYGQLKLIGITYSGKKNFVCSYYTKEANTSTDTTARASLGLSALTPVAADESNLASAFTTYHIVFDLDNQTMAYYVGDSTKPAQVNVLPASAEFFASNTTYLQIQGAYNATEDANSTYFKSFIITYGDIVDTFR